MLLSNFVGHENERQRSRILAISILPATPSAIFASIIFAVASIFAALTSVTAAESGFNSPRAITLSPDPEAAVKFDGYLDRSIDSTGEATLADMLTSRRDTFSPVSGRDTNLGYTESAVWLRFALKLPAEATKPRTLLLSLTPNFTDVLDVYTAQGQPDLSAADFRRSEMGDHAPTLTSEFTGLDNVLPLIVSPGSPTFVYIRAASVNSSINISLSVYSPIKFGTKTTVDNLVRGFWFGGMTILMIIQIVFFCFERRPFYVFLALNILGATLVYFGNLGLSSLLFFPNGGFGNDYFTGLSAWLGLSAGAVSVASILELRPRSPWLYRTFIVGAAVGLVGIPFVLLDQNRVFAPIASLVIFALTSTAAFVALRDFTKFRDAETGLRATAFLLLWAGLILTSAQRLAIFSLPNWLAHSYAATGICHFILLTGSLAVRLRDAENRNRENDRRAIVISQAAERRAQETVVQKTQELVAAKKTAEDALKAELEAQARQVRFMEVISHQYRTPLAAIRSNVDSIRISLGKTDAGNLERVERTRQGIARLVEVLEVNLSRSRLQGSFFQPKLIPQPIAKVVETSRDRARDLTQAEISLVVSCEAGSVDVLADTEMLSIAILNLIENAVKFSAGTTDPTIQIRVSVIDDLVLVEVEDNGIGIPFDEREAVLRKGVRASNASHIQGTGTGLALVSRIAEAHSGSLTLSSSEKGVGTVALLVLPLYRN